MKNFARVNCSYCGKIFKRELRRDLEAQKYGWKPYCSHACQSGAKNKHIEVVCQNPDCKISFKKSLRETKKTVNSFCSRSCAATINNKKFPKRKIKIKNCIVCTKKFIGDAKCCSIVCRKIHLTSLIVTKTKIVYLIKDFYKKYERAPLKREFRHAKAARNRFGTWNKAVEAAGFSPNPVMFAHKHTAKDGHICDSLSEKIIDDWLFKHKIAHELHVPYGQNNMSADFRIGNMYVEFIGLRGELKRYDDLFKRKKEMWLRNNLQVVKIYPKDLFPKNKLGELFGDLL